MIIFLLISLVAAENFIAYITSTGTPGPKSTYPFNSQLWEEREMNHLTDYGKHEMFKAGVDFWEANYLSYNQLLSKNYVPAQIVAMAADDEIAIESAYAWLQGLYPMGSGPQTRLNIHPPINISSETQRFINSLGTNALPDGLTLIPVHSQGISHDYKFHVLDNCQHILGEMKEVAESEDYELMQQSKAILLHDMSNQLEISVDNIEEALEIRDALLIDNIAKNSSVGDDFREELDNLELFYEATMHSLDEHHISLVCSAMFEDLRDRLEAYATTPLRLALYSMPRSSFRSFLNCFSFSPARTVAYADDIQIIVSKDDEVKVMYNGKPLSSGCASPCHVSHFIEMLSEKIVKNIESDCKLN